MGRTDVSVIAGICIAAPLILLASHRILDATEHRIIEREAIKVAEIAAEAALATRAAYSHHVLERLVTRDGESARDTSLPIPPPEEFVNAVSERSRATGGEGYTYRWLSPRMGHDGLDEFQRSAWLALEEQASGSPGQADEWPAIWQLGTHEGTPMLRYVRAMPASPAGGLAAVLEVQVPVEKVAAFAAMQSRGTQFLLVALAVLGLTLLTMLAVRAAHRQKSLARRYELLAKVDTLTGLPNRLAIEQAMEDRLGAAAGANKALGVMLIDIDDFKNINDSLGHAAGDLVLREVASRLQAALRESDLVARYSGDEFVVLVDNVANVQRLGAVAAKLLESASPLIPVQDNDIFVTLSIGIATFPLDGKDVPTLLRHADSAMYRVKDSGRNGFQYFAAEMNEAAVEKLKLSSSLRHALHRNEFLVYYQPKAEALTGRIVGFEALVRWQHPQQGILGPGRFIPHAEKCGAIEPLGEWVLRAALAQARAWRDTRGFTGTIAVNLSMRQLYNPQLPAMVAKALADCGIAPDRLELEVTESMVSLNPELAAGTLHEISRLGVSVAIDDFGTGQSSLAYLLRFPIRTMKIDRLFTADVPHREDACSIVRGIIGLAKSLRMRLVAEGVESHEQRGFLEREGCDEIQGFLVGAPLPPGDAALLIGTASA